MQPVLFLLIFSAYCHSVIMTTDFRDRCDHEFPRFAGPSDIKIMCGFNPQHWCVSQLNGSEIVLNVAEDAALSTSPRLLTISNLSVGMEGEYKCRRDSEDFVTTRECVFVIGRAQYTCSHYRNCTDRLTAPEGTTVVVDASVVFLQGGHYNQPLLFLRVRDDSNFPIYFCNATREGCGETDKIKVEFQQVNEDAINVTVALKNVSTRDSGNYTIQFVTLHVESIFADFDQGQRGEILLHYHLNVTEAQPTEPTLTTTPESTTSTEHTSSEVTTSTEHAPSETTTEASTSVSASSDTDSPSTTPATEGVVVEPSFPVSTLISVVVSVLLVIVVVVVAVVAAVVWSRNRRDMSSLSPQKRKQVVIAHSNRVSIASEVFEDVVIVRDNSCKPRTVVQPPLSGLQTGAGGPESSSSVGINSSSSSSSIGSSPETSTTSHGSAQVILRLHQPQQQRQSQRESIGGSLVHLSGDLFSHAVKI